MTLINSNIRLTQLSGTIRQPAVAGLFYPDDPDQLRQTVIQLLESSHPDASPPKALIVPHAGYIYSGAVAAQAYATLLPVRDKIRRVVLLGPAHRVYLKGLALSTASRFATPLGLIEIDKTAVERLKHFPQVQIMEAAHAQEHSLEVHLPFLQAILNDFTLIPLVVGDTPPEQVAQVLESVWGGDETLIIISSDLSHYHDYATASGIDSKTGQLIKKMNYEAIGPHEACGCMPMHGLLKIAREHGMNVKILDLRNSGDTAGPRDRVVGYGAFAIYPVIHERQEHENTLLDLAMQSIQLGFETGRALHPDVTKYEPDLREPRATFVTLMTNGTLRGCMGTTEPVSPLVVSVAESAFNAAFRDPRFPALTRDEFKNIELGISVLTPKTEIHFESEKDLLSQLEPGTDGLVIEKGNLKSTFLPSVWESLPRPREFLDHLKQKAGMKSTDVPTRAWRYHSESFKKRPEK